MAITYIVGNPGSGKTYFAVNQIYEYFVLPTLPNKRILGFEIKRKLKIFDYLYCYTNINGLKFDISDKLISFDFDIFYLNLTHLYNLYNQGLNDDELNIKANELNLFKVMFVIDEAHNFLKNKDDKILIWWLTYHRHLHQEIIFITQDLSLISNEYKRIAEFFYKALDSGKRIYKNSLRYVQFSSYKLYQKDIVTRFSLSLNKEVFSLYKSGDNKPNKSFFLKVFTFLLFSILTLIFCFYIFISFFKSDEIKENNISKESNINLNLNISPNTIKDKSENNLFSNLELIDGSLKDLPLKNVDINNSSVYKILCIDTTCHIDDKNQNFMHFPLEYFHFILNEFPPIYHYKNKVNKGYQHFIIFNFEVFNNLKKGVLKNEKNTSFTRSLF
ncbi:zonular occludens toxin domain-containing protein [Campylobacter jejuni]|nr:zonular occludens toxin domain-containing protein [Campylobacter jejuni]EAL4982274.1 hypothetical protein [Campylobacter coli]ALM60261.1 hypothetical protein ASB61_06215 [Campylobacter jejuni]EAH5024886.1 hypothetical protein [Campylobacter jejuni]EAH5460346.1 hypothetical protein [Campylobacter jejuni]EAH5604035.1 hypothetical protein [Campylobacter jejuni]